MNKGELVAAAAERTKMPTSQVDNVLKAIIDSIQAALVKGDKVAIPGFASFEVVSRPARQGRNPRTGETMTIAAGKKIKVSPSKAFKDAVN